MTQYKDAWSSYRTPKKTTQPYVPPSWDTTLASVRAAAAKDRAAREASRAPISGRNTGVTGNTNYTGYQPIQEFKFPEYSGYQGMDWQSLLKGITTPQAPVVTQQMIQDWIKRATEEAGLMYDPQIAGIGRELESSLLASEQTKGNIPAYYEDIMKAIREWQTTTTEEEQRRWYARGLGRGGGLVEAEADVAKTALGETTKAETEKARKLTDIEEQEALLKKQAGQKTTEAETARSQYIASRQADLRNTYETNQAQISQKQFENQMQIAQFGLTAESQNFTNYLNQKSAENDAWYKNALVNLEQQTLKYNQAASSGMATKEPTVYVPGLGNVSQSLAASMGYGQPGKYASTSSEPSIWNYIASGGDVSNIQQYASYMATGKLPNTVKSSGTSGTKTSYGASGLW